MRVVRLRKARRPVEFSTRALIGALGAFTAVAAILVPGPTQNAVANGDTRTLTLYHAHTRESIQATFMVNGRYDTAVLEKLNWFLRDWRIDEPTHMDPRLFDVVWEAYRQSGSQEPIEVVSAYRSPQTNAMLRRRSKAVAEHSQHMLGKAMDMHYMDVPMSRVREIAMKMQRGGVGYYPTAGTPFVHLDVGSVRAWPRMTYDQLARLFPDGKTVHLPANGHPMARYEEARAEIMARNGQSVPSVAEVKSKGLLASLFGWGEEEEPAAAPAPTGPRSRMVALVSRDARRAPAPEEDEGPRSTPVVQRAQADLPRGDTFLQPPPSSPPSARSAAPAEPRVMAALDAPLPPRRPNELLASLDRDSSAPLPPSRPADLARQTVAELRPATLRPGDLPAVITAGTSHATGAPAPLPVPVGLLAYAPQPAAPPLANAALAREVPLPPVRAIALHASPSAPQAQAIGIRAASHVRAPRLVAARLDRSNFRVLTAPAQIAKLAPGGIGPAAAPVRAAARADLLGMAFSSRASIPGRFSTAAPALDEARFTGPAVQPLARYEAAAARTDLSREAFN